MNQNTLKNIIIGLLVIIILLLLYLYYSKATPIPSANTTSNTNIPTVEKSSLPVILDSPYLYDSGYWVSPDAWWMSPDAGSTYVHNNYKTNYNYYYDKATNSTKPIPTTTTAMSTPAMSTSALSTPAFTGMQPPQPNSTSSATLPSIQATNQLISPSQDSIFPLPTLASLSQIPTPTTLSAMQQPEQIPISSIMADSMAAKVDIQASQLLEMRAGNNNLEPAMP